ncbi:hypothetical protein J2792_000438 [Novosphingobium capsulatum]|uniref:TadE-like protein n=1 Tax=Novosphingobium capsulatum TaxID=13688 RepID=A0ABU1MGY4_9SPHN|nr:MULTISPECIES: hypothetical protein [Novosphingobium]KPF55419.1 hypothetical protein IP65_04690 [Novosphingobium sp. AAP1]MDR6509598.1 hypothetical protein [Novosphingobium capsulatum]PTR08252.1 hypothetical protein C8K11_11283 [Novosphingobium sp. GV055]PUB01006.1 hypothetical protein C8K12_11283 [Novosphingobium sp. GV061]PUB16539.1 hypothetical protein C8K14_11283 [Novosphingobium sp. GV079]
MLKRRSLFPLLRRLARNTSAVTVVELGVSLPFVMVMALGSMEMVNLGILHVRLNQLAISVADNASRAKQSVVGGAPMFREFDVNQVFTGAALSVEDLNFPVNGRVILSSLETNSSGGQWIHWQRCWGSNKYVSRYGVQGTGSTGTSFAGMGQPTPITVESPYAMMYVEVAYNYQPLFFGTVFKTTVIRKDAAMYVRDDRDLTQIYNPAPAVTPATC